MSGTLVFNDDGSLSSASFRGTAANAAGNDRDLSQKDLETIGKTAAALFQQAAGKNFGPMDSTKSELASAVAAQESRLGKNAPSNPLQLSPSSGMRPSRTSVQSNVSRALDLLAERVRKYDLFKALEKYNAAADPKGYARKVIQYYEQIRSSETKTAVQPQSPSSKPTPPN